MQVRAPTLQIVKNLNIIYSQPSDCVVSLYWQFCIRRSKNLRSHNMFSLLKTYTCKWTHSFQNICYCLPCSKQSFPGGVSCQCRKHKGCSLIPLSRRSPGIGNDNPVQYSSMENSMGRGVCQATVHGVAKSQT